ncbi:FkbM family methyltransferase [Gemmatimonas aurantiaca]|nr:FkbM family methyltransferase [Gemmatimonas aurantiaca]
MKLRELIYLLGFKPSVTEYLFEIRSFDLLGYGNVDYAQWLHPAEGEKRIELAAINELKSFLSEGDFCIDIGAHTGDTAIPMALAVGASGAVLALEPNKYVYAVLKENSRLNRETTNIIPLMAAATTEDGPVEFEYSDAGYCNGGRHQGISALKHGHAFKLEVAGINLAQRLRIQHSDLLPRLKYIKIDTEGYDLYVLKSLTEIIERHKPYLLVEIYKHSSQDYRKEIFDFLSKRNYALHKRASEENFKGERLSQGEMNNWKHFDIFCVPSD